MKMDIPPLSSSFLSAGFINPDTIQGDEEEVMVDMAETFGRLSIDMVEVEDQEAKDTGHRTAPIPTWTDSKQLDFHRTPCCL